MKGFHMANSSKPVLPLLILLLSAVPVAACPFCSAVSQTFSEEIQSMDVAVICQLKTVGVFRSDLNENPQAEIPKSTFEVSKVIKGDEFVSVGDTFKCVYFGEAKKDRPFLATATDAPKLQWSTPLILTSRAENYLGLLKTIDNTEQSLQLRKLQAQLRELQAKLNRGTTDAATTNRPEKGEPPELVALQKTIDHLESKLSVKRLEFFQDYLEDEDEMLARDAYDEFAKAPYAAVQGLRPKMDHDRLIAFLNNPDVPSNRRRLYFTHAWCMWSAGRRGTA